MSDKKALEQGKVVPFLFAIDDGSGNMEIHFEDAKGSVFESKSASCVVEAVLADLAGGISNNAWETEGKQYTVAKSHTDAMDTCSAKYQLSPANRVLVHNAIAETGVGSQPVYLGVTLPTEQFYTRGAGAIVNHERIEQKKKNLLTACENMTGAFARPNIAGIKVYPEAIPAYVYTSSLSPETYPAEHTTLVVDLGRYTCDLAIISTGYQVTSFMTTEHGVQKLVDKFKVLLQQKSSSLGLNDISAFSATNIDQIIDLGYIGSTLETEQAIAARKDVSDLVLEAKEFLNAKILEDAIALAGGDFSMLTRIVFVGGGANWLNEQAQQWYHTVDVPAEPEMAIVRGAYMMLKNSKASILAELNIDETPAAPAAEEEPTEA